MAIGEHSSAPEPGTGLVSIRDLRFAYPGTRAAVVEIDRFDLDAGERVFVRGPSGCGKTTLLSLIAGVLVATGGELRLDGRDWRSVSPAGRDRVRADRIGYIFQQFNLLPYLSVLDNVLLPCRFSKLRFERAGGTNAACRAAAERLLATMGLGAEHVRRPVARLSVGQQQRVAAARALIGQPELVIADEPTSALDEALRESFMRVLLEACAEAGSALIFVSHDARLAERFSSQVDLARLNRAAAPKRDADSGMDAGAGAGREASDATRRATTP